MDLALRRMHGLKSKRGERMCRAYGRKAEQIRKHSLRSGSRSTFQFLATLLRGFKGNRLDIMEGSMPISKSYVGKPNHASPLKGRLVELDSTFRAISPNKAKRLMHCVVYLDSMFNEVSRQKVRKPYITFHPYNGLWFVAFLAGEAYHFP